MPAAPRSGQRHDPAPRLEQRVRRKLMPTAPRLEQRPARALHGQRALQLRNSYFPARAGSSNLSRLTAPRPGQRPAAAPRLGQRSLLSMYLIPPPKNMSPTAPRQGQRPAAAPRLGQRSLQSNHL